MDHSYISRHRSRSDRPDPGSRLGSGVLDYLIFMFLIFVLCAPVMLMGVIRAVGTGVSPDFFPPQCLVSVVVGYALFLSKDMLNGRSPGKRIVKLQVIDRRTGLAANPLRCLVRNLTLAIWPLEVILVLVNPQRRLGDRIAGTEVRIIGTMPKAGPVNGGQRFGALLASLLVCALFVAPFYMLSRMMRGTEPRYLPQFYNPQASADAEAFLLARFPGTLQTAEVAIYDRMASEPRRFVAIDLRVPEQELLQRSGDFQKSLHATLDSLFPKAAYGRRVHYEFRSGMNMSLRTESD